LWGIFFQDLKDRMVWAWLFIVFMLAGGLLHFYSVETTSFLINIGINVIIVTGILAILKIYVTYKMGVESLQNTFGMGDIFCLFALALSFSTVTFVILLVFGFIFSLLIHNARVFLLSRKRPLPHNETTVPLAGYLSLFFSGIYITHWIGLYDDLYVL